MRKLFSGKIGCIFLLGVVVLFDHIERGLAYALMCGTAEFVNGVDTVNFFENLVVAAVTDWSFASRVGTLVNPNIGFSPEAAYIQTQQNLYDVLYTEDNLSNFLFSTGAGTNPPANAFLAKTCAGADIGAGLAAGVGPGYVCASATCGACAYSFYKNAMQGLYDYANANPGQFACSGTASVTSFTTPASYASFHTITGISNLATLATDYVCVTALKAAIDSFNDCNTSLVSPGDMRTGVSYIRQSCSALDYVGPELFMNMLVAAVVDYMTLGATPQSQLLVATGLYGATGLTATSLPSHSTYLRMSDNFGAVGTGYCGHCAYTMYSSMVSALDGFHTSTGSYACVASGKTAADFTTQSYITFTTDAGISAYDLLTDTTCMTAVLDSVAGFNVCSGSAGSLYDVRTGLVTTRSTCVDLDFIGYDFFANLMIAAVLDFQFYCSYNSACADHTSAGQSQDSLITSLYSGSHKLISAVSYPNPYLVANLGNTAFGSCGACAFSFYQEVIDILSAYYYGVPGNYYVCLQGGPSVTNPNASANDYDGFLTNSQYPSIKNLVVDESCISVVQAAIEAFNTCAGIPSGFDLRTGKKRIRSQCVDLDFVTGQFFKNLLVAAVVDANVVGSMPLGSGTLLSSALFDNSKGLTLSTVPVTNSFLYNNLGDSTAHSCGLCAYGFYLDAYAGLEAYSAVNTATTAAPVACAIGPDVAAVTYNSFNSDAGVNIDALPTDYVCIGALQLAIDNFYNCLRGASGVTATLDVRTGNSTTMCDVPPSSGSATTEFLSFEVQYNAYTEMMTTAYEAGGTGTGTFPPTLTAAVTDLPCGVCFEQFFQTMVADDHTPTVGGFVGSGEVCDASTTPPTAIYGTSCVNSANMQNALNQVSICAGTYNVLSTSQSFPVSAPVEALWNHAVWGLEAVVVCAANSATDPSTGTGLNSWKTCLTNIVTAPIAGSSNSLVDPSNASDLTCFIQLAAAVFADSGTGGAKLVCTTSIDTTCKNRLSASTSVAFTAPYLGLSVVPNNSLLSSFQACSGFAATTTAPTTTCVSTVPDTYLSYVPLVAIAIEAVDPATAAKAIFDSADYTSSPLGGILASCFGCWARFAAEVNAGFTANPNDKLTCIENPYAMGAGKCNTTPTVATALTRFQTCSGNTLTAETPPTSASSNYTPFYFANLLGAAVVDWSYAYYANGGVRPGLNNGTQTATALKSKIYDATNGFSSQNTFLNTASPGVGLDASAGYGLCAYRFYTDVFNGLDNFNRVNGAFICTSAASGYSSEYHYSTWSEGSSNTDPGCIAAIQYAIDNYDNCVDDGYDIRTAALGLVPSSVSSAEKFAMFDGQYNPYGVIMTSALGPGGGLPASLMAGISAVGGVECLSCLIIFYTAIATAKAALLTPCADIHSPLCLSQPSVGNALAAFGVCAGTNNVMNTNLANPVSKPVRDLWNAAIWGLEPIALCSSQYDPLEDATALSNWYTCLTKVTGTGVVAGASIALIAPTIQSDSYCFTQFGSTINSIPALSSVCTSAASLASDGTGACYNALTARSFGWSVEYPTMSVAPLNSYLDQFYACSGIDLAPTSPTSTCRDGVTPLPPPAEPYDSYIPLLSIALLAEDPASAAEAVFNSADLSAGILPTYQSCYGCWARFSAELNAGFALSPSDKAVCLQNIYGIGTNQCIQTVTMASAFGNFNTCSGISLTIGPTVTNTCAATDYNESEFYLNLVVAAVVDWSHTYYNESPSAARPGFNNGVQTTADLKSFLYTGSGLSVGPPPSVPAPNTFLSTHLTDGEGCGLCAYRFYTDAFNSIDNYNRQNPTTFPCTATGGNSYATAHTYNLWLTNTVLLGHTPASVLSDESCVSVLQFAIDNFHSCSGTALNVDVRIGTDIGPNVAVSGNFVGTGLFQNLITAAVTDWMHATYNGGGTLSPTIDGGDAGDGPTLFANLYGNSKVAAGTGLSSLTSPTKISFLYSVLPSSPASPSALCAYNFYRDALADLFNYDQAYSAYACVGSGKLPSNFATAMDYANFTINAGQPAAFFATDDTCIYAIQHAVNNFYICNDVIADIMTGTQPYQCLATDYMASTDTTNMYQNLMVAAIYDYMNTPLVVTGNGITGLTTLLNNMYDSGTNPLRLILDPTANPFLVGYVANTALVNKGINDCGYCGYLFYKNVIKSLFDYSARTSTYGCIGDADITAFTSTSHDYIAFNSITDVMQSTDFTNSYTCVAAVQPAIDLYLTCAGAGRTVGAHSSPYDIRTGSPVWKADSCAVEDFVETGLFQDVLVAAVVDFMYAYNVNPAVTAVGATTSGTTSYFEFFVDPTNANRITATTNPVHNTYLLYNDSIYNSCSVCGFLFYQNVIAGLHDYAAAHVNAVNPADKFACTNGKIASYFTTQYGYALFATTTGVTDLSTFASDYVCVEALQAAINAFYECVKPGLIDIDVRTGTTSTMCDTATSPITNVFIDLDAQFGIYSSIMNAALVNAGFPSALTTALAGVDCSSCFTAFYAAINANRAQLVGAGSKPCDENPDGIYASSCTTESTYVVPAMQAFELCAGIQNKMYLKPRHPVSAETQAVWNFAVWGLQPVVLCGIHAAQDPAVNADSWKSCLTTVPSTYGGSPALTTPTNPDELSCFIELASAARALFSANCSTAIAGACLTDLMTRTQPFTSPYTELSVEVKDSLLDQFYVCSGFKLATVGPVTQCTSIPLAPYGSYIPMLSIALQATSPGLAADGVLHAPDLVTYLGSSPCWTCYVRLAAELNAGFANSRADKQICIDNIYGKGIGKCGPDGAAIGTLTVTNAVNRFQDCAVITTFADNPQGCSLVMGDFGTTGTSATYYQNLVVAAVVDWSTAYNAGGPRRPGINNGVSGQTSLKTALYDEAGSLISTTTPPNNDFLSNTPGLSLATWCFMCAYRFYLDVFNSLDGYNRATTGFACTSSATAYTVPGLYSGWYTSSSSTDPNSLATDYSCVGALQFAINNFNNCAGDIVTGTPIVDIKTGDLNLMCEREEFLNFDSINGIYTAIMQSALATSAGFPSTLITTGLTCAQCLSNFSSLIVDGNAAPPHVYSIACDGVDGVTLIPEIYSTGSGSCIDKVLPNGVYLALQELHVCIGTHNKLNTWPRYPTEPKVNALWNHAFWGLEPVVACGAEDAIADPAVATGAPPTGLSWWEHCLNGTVGLAVGANNYLNVSNFLPTDMKCFNQLASNVYNQIAPTPLTTKSDCSGITISNTIPDSCLFDISLNTTNAFSTAAVGLSVTPSDSLVVQFYKCSGFELSLKNPTGACTNPANVLFEAIPPWVSIAIESVDPASAALEALTRGYISSPTDLEGGQSCWNCYARLAAELRALFSIPLHAGDLAACLANVYDGDGCLTSNPVSTAVSHYSVCASRDLDEWPSFLCTNADHTAWQNANIPLMVMYLASTSSSYSAALTSLRLLLVPVATTATDAFACQYCFEKLLFDLYTLVQTPVDIGPCMDDLSLPQCQSIAGSVISNFQYCSGYDLDYDHATPATPVCQPSLYSTGSELFYENLMVAAVVDFTHGGNLTGGLPNALALATALGDGGTGLGGATTPQIDNGLVVELTGADSIPTACGACAYHLYTNLIKVFNYHGTVAPVCTVSATTTTYGGGTAHSYNTWGTSAGSSPQGTLQNVTCVAVVQTALDVFNKCAQNNNNIRTGYPSAQCSADQFLNLDASFGVYELLMNHAQNSASPPMPFTTAVELLPCGPCIGGFFETLYGFRNTIFGTGAACVVNGIYSIGPSSTNCIDTSTVTTFVYGAILNLERCVGMSNQLYLARTYHPTLPEQLLFNQVIPSYKPVVECVDSLLSPLPGANPGNTPGTITSAWKTCLASFQQNGSPALTMPDLDMTCFQQFAHNVADFTLAASFDCGVLTASPNAFYDSCLSSIAVRNLTTYLSPTLMPPPRSMFDQFYLCAGFTISTNNNAITCSDGAVQPEQLGYSAYATIALAANDTSNASYNTLIDPTLLPLIGSVACFDCFARFSAEMKALPNFATDCSSVFALSCWEAVGINVVDAPGYNFHVCSGLNLLNDGSGYQCTIEEYNIWESVNLIQNTMNVIVSALSAESAVTEYKRLMGEIKTANPDHPFNCDYCFQVLVKTMYTIGTTLDLTFCVTNPSSNECYAIAGVADAYSKFQQCSAMRFNYLSHTITPLDPRTASNTTTTTIAPVTTTETPIGGGGGDGTTTTTTIIPIETTTTAAPETSEPPTTSTKSVSASPFSVWLICLVALVMKLL